MTKKIVILGAGKSSSYLIKYLYSKRFELGININIFSDKYADYLDDFKDINFEILDINDTSNLEELIYNTYILISLLPPFMHFKIANLCSKKGINMITASYLDEKIKTLENSFIKNDSFLFMEMGLDPGIDHMSAMSIIESLNKRGDILEFESYTGGLIKYDINSNPWGYKFTWNPMNVIIAGADGATYLSENNIKSIPYNKVFKDLSKINLTPTESYEGYPNRDSLKYKELYNLHGVKTLKRGTIRNKSFCKTWSVLIDLGLTNDKKSISNDDNMSYFDFFNYNIKAKNYNELVDVLKLEYGIMPTSQEFKNLVWSGFLSDKKFKIKRGKFSDFLLSILKDKWTLDNDDIDEIVMVHTLIFKTAKSLKKLTSFLKIEGEDKTYTAMSKTVGLPIAVLVEHIININFNKSGIHLPFEKNIYEPVLERLSELGINFIEKEINI
ncbi:MAG: saccharopine dehydrogenase C-terminal domain-containing protein [Flammeovirgaceae bacterium]